MNPPLSRLERELTEDAPAPTRGRVFPFSAIVGQQEMKLALKLNAVDPGVGGVLVRGEKGTAKSTAVRGLAAILPRIETAARCPFGCDPTDVRLMCDHCRERLNAGQSLDMAFKKVRVVDLPLNATEDMVLGGLDFGKAVKTGRRHFMPGLLAKANRGFLYVDEVNLLDDHLVDVILDAAASGWNRLEREGVSFNHPARFVLVGTMNPEEGELRPQLLDRFGLCVEVGGEREPEARVELMELREAFDRDPEAFCGQRRQADMAVAAEVERAREILPSVSLPRRLRGFITALCIENNVAGHRADLVIERAAKALAALHGRREVSQEDIATVAPLALRHRRRDAAPPPPEPPKPPEDPAPEPPEQEQNDHNDQDQPEPPPEDGQDRQNDGDADEGFDLPLPEAPDQGQDTDSDAGDDPPEEIYQIGQTFKVKPIRQPKDRKLRRGSGRRSATRTAQKLGRYVKSSLHGPEQDLALDATLRAAAPHQLVRRERATGLAVCIKPQDLRLKVREKRVGNFLLFLVDASGSMGAQARMSATKGAVLSLLLDAYQKRDRVALITFRGREAQLALPPTSSIDLAAKLLAELPVGGRTPLAAGLLRAHEQLTRHLRKDPDGRPIVLVLTDGRANAGLGSDAPPHEEAITMAERMGQDERVHYVVVDTEAPGIVRLNIAARLATALGGDYFKIDDLKAQDLVDIIKKD
ncbi:Magnesium chelatase [Desulfarculus baarsii DSM 2075]|uniref:Mg-protoporphyrin IX chelatase n=2 Tax=Desulfarculus baarsii TaxID=453230 RepID=E1QJY5_DESB2|nr:Magnesium chelatase [Desulfarculus baarsii DSM 2075]